VLGRKGERQHKKFKGFFTVKDPLKIAPPKVTHHWKADPFFAHIQTSSMEAWDSGQDISGDQQTIS
jgi:hypothetical protein